VARQKAFTLIELLVVIAIIALLLAILLPVAKTTAYGSIGSLARRVFFYIRGWRRCGVTSRATTP